MYQYITTFLLELSMRTKKCGYISTSKEKRSAITCFGVKPRSIWVKRTNFLKKKQV